MSQTDTSQEQATVIPNPYLLLCPHGDLICWKCLEYDEKFGSLCGCDECNHRQRRWERQEKEHMVKYDHSVLVKP